MKKYSTSEIPKTEEEVMESLTYDNETITTAMRGIARCRIRMGHTPLQAYQYALEVYLGIDHEEVES